ncbi:Aste57867_25157 [Aphanomyces stellatus]|uniref:Aste57867_25157 protein n=1 Tax=Aphanomyces stellatus TaxID=120398 RepID=A0A485LTR9_9STRA|nr:hypothetical protein As57867_025079 [Aphanomyces stellatus]VFU01786.1 Aste57867_25157 [Aphanomyces stellatus]
MGSLFMPKMLHGCFHQILLHLDGVVILRASVCVCHAWRHAAHADDLWHDILQREFPLSVLQPMPNAKWIAVYIAERRRLRRAHMSTTPLCLDGSKLHVTLDNKAFNVALPLDRHVDLRGRGVWLKKSTFGLTTTISIDLVLTGTHVALDTLPGPRKFHLSTLEIDRAGCTLHLLRLHHHPKLVRLASDDQAIAWVVAIAHNIRVFRASCAAVLPPPRVAPLSPSSKALSAADARLVHLRKVHAFRFKQLLSPRRASPLSANVVMALQAKTPFDHRHDERMHPHLAAPRCVGCGRPLPSSPRPTKFCSPPCQQKAQHTQRHVRRACGALHLLPDPSTIVLALLRDPDSFEGHASMQFLVSSTQKAAPATPSACHRLLCDTRDVVANLANYMLAHRQPELARCEMDATSDAMRAAVLAAIEKHVWHAMQPRLEAWTRQCTQLHDADMRAHIQKWSCTPPSSPHFGLAVEFQGVAWDTPTQLLREMEAESMPSAKLRSLLAAAKAIYATFAASQADVARTLAADDFLPIFIFCVCRSEMAAPLATLECMWALCNEDALQGEGGYYLTMFEASLEYIRTTSTSGDAPR